MKCCRLGSKVAIMLFLVAKMLEAVRRRGRGESCLEEEERVAWRKKRGYIGLEPSGVAIFAGTFESAE